MNAPRPNAQADDEAIAEMCRWLKANRMVGLGTRSGRLVLLPADSVYGRKTEPVPLKPGGLA